MKKLLLAALAGVALSACAPTKQATDIAAQGQLYCAKASALAPLVVAISNASGVPVTVTNQTAAYVAAACAAWSAAAVPVMPPTAPVPSVAVAVP